VGGQPISVAQNGILNSLFSMVCWQLCPPAPTLLHFLPSSVFLWPAILELIHNLVISLSHFFVIFLPPWQVGLWEVLIKDQL